MISQCSIKLLEAALAGSLPADEEAALHRHLEECEACGAALEQLAGGATWRQEAAALLAGDDLDEAVPVHDEWSEVDFTVEHLEPADEPNVLGRLGGYDVLEIIGRGGMGVVLKAFDRELNRCVAIKVLAPHLAHSSLAKKRFAREAQAAAAVVHPHVLAIHQVQPGGRLPFLVMPLVAGESLAERLRAQGPLELKEILRIGMQAAAGLAAAHDQGLVHRDVKPANILLERGVERAVLTDFGLARAADDVSMTRWGIVAGTPEYMSPEQAKGEPLDGRSDLFSLGCVLYEMATGVSPFRTDSALATMRRLVDEPPPALAALNPELPPWFIVIVDRLLAKDPARRFSSAKEVSDLLEGCLAHVQQPATVPLPAGLPKPALRGAWRLSNIRIKGVLAMIGTLVIGLSGILLLSAEPPDVSGEWSGTDWGEVVLKQTGDGEYGGTFTDTFGKEPGKIELQWSRIERRYNGTWSEGNDRFGKISLRLVGDEIRGAWTTNRKSKINPGTPELADLLWVRGKPDAQGKDAPGRPGKIGQKLADSNWAFGPDIRRTLYFSSSTISPLGHSALRLDDGKVFNLPKKSASPKENKEVMSHEEQEKWYNETRVNFVIDYRKKTDQWEMKLRNVKFAELSDESWKTLSANELEGRFSKLAWRKATTAEKDQKEKGFYSLIMTRGMKPPMTFAFETSAGHRGIFQFYAFNIRAMGSANALIRYKQLQQSDTSTNVKGDGGKTAATSPAQPDRPQPETKTAAPKRVHHFSTGMRVKTIAYSADGKLIAIANGTPTLILQGNGTSRLKDNWAPSAEILDARTGKTVVSLKLTTNDEDIVLAATERVPDFEVTALAFSPDGKVVAVGTTVGQVKLFHARTGKLVRSLDDKQAKLADKKTPENLKSLTRAMGSVASLAFSPDGSLLAMCGGSFGDSSLVHSRIESGGLTRKVTGPGRLKVWEVKTGTLKHDLVGHSHANAVAFSPDGNLLASAGRWEHAHEWGTGVIIWNPHTGKKLRTFEKRANGGADAVAFSPDSKLVAIGTVSFDKDKWDNASTGAVSVTHVASGIMDWQATVPGWAKPVAFAPAGKSVAVHCAGRSIRFFDTETGAVKHEIQSADSPWGGRRNDFAIAPQGHRLAIGGANAEKRGFVEVWDLDGAPAQGK